jgi:hypothetical protein
MCVSDYRFLRTEDPKSIKLSYSGLFSATAGGETFTAEDNDSNIVRVHQRVFLNVKRMVDTAEDVVSNESNKIKPPHRRVRSYQHRSESFAIPWTYWVVALIKVSSSKRTQCRWQLLLGI